MNLKSPDNLQHYLVFLLSKMQVSFQVRLQTIASYDPLVITCC